MFAISSQQNYEPYEGDESLFAPATERTTKCRPADLVGVQVYLTGEATFERMNVVYQAFFKDPRLTGRRS